MALKSAFLLLFSLTVVECFTSIPTRSTSFAPKTVSSTFHSMSSSPSSDSDDQNSFNNFFSGGVFLSEGKYGTKLDEDEVMKKATLLASKIRTVKDLGWTGATGARKGNMRPRHRAFGGENELAVQDKPGYGTIGSKEFTPEKWLSQDEFNRLMKVRSVNGVTPPESDVVFVALAGGNAYAERYRVEEILSKWRNGRSFDEEEFMKSVKKGQFDLILGWSFYLSVVLTAALGIVFPTNPVNKALEYSLASAGLGHL